MSNLILPNHHVNQVLENNLKAFFARYPHEQSRLENLLRKPAKNFPLINIEVPPAPSKPPIRVLLLTGIANPTFLAALLNDATVRKECFKLFVIENDPEFIAFCFQNADLTQIINYPKTEWFICHSTESIKSAFFRALKPESVTSVMFNVQTLNVKSERDETLESFYQQVPAIYNETVQHVLHNHGNIDDSVLGVEVTVRNQKYLLDAPGIKDLKGHYKGCSALVIGAGSSLDQNLETIKKYQDRFVIIAADAAVKPLTQNGIRVDFCTSIERLNSYQKPFFENLENNTADLVAFPVVHPEVLDSFPGRVRIVYRNYSFFAYFEKAYPKGILRCGGSTSHLGMRLADYMGCRRVFMIGLDSAYEEKDGLYRSHCSGTGHPEWGEFIPLADFNQKRRHQPPIKAINNLGQEAMTNITYYQWVKEYAEELAYLGQRMTIKNCSALGLKIDGIPYIDLETAAKDLDPMLVEKPVPERAQITRGWDHKDLVKNLTAWKQICEDGIKEADELLAMETIDSARYDALFYVCNFRLVVDDLFVAFVIQCCAHDFFHLDNVFYSYSLEHGADLKEKTKVFKDRFSLFIKTIDKLLKAFNGGEN